MKSERLLFTIAAMMLLLPLAAQEKAQSGMHFWKHLTLGGEIGTMGIGLELATPLHPNIRLRAGIVALPCALREDYTIAVDMVSTKGNSYDYMVAKDERVAHILQSTGYPLHFFDFFKPPLVVVEEKLRRIEGKVLVDFYPKRGSWFYFTAGAYIGGMSQRRITGQIDPLYVRAANLLNEYLPEDDKMHVLVWDDMRDYYCETEVKPSGKVDYSFRILPVKPYVGIGFGRMLSKRKLGCHFDLGILYRGRWKVHCDGYHWDKTKSSYATWCMYGVAALRLTGQLF